MPEQPSDPADRVTFVDASVPRLPAGEYLIEATQTLTVLEPGAAPASVSFSASKTFYVHAPRFLLAPDEIYGCYPPDGQTGAWRDTLPHVVFRRPTLPWERSLRTAGADTGPPEPWLALLVFDESEIAEPMFASRSFAETVTPIEAAIAGPAITLMPWERPAAADPKQPGSQTCTCLDIPWDLFRRVAPRRADLAFLSHARRVATDDKEDHPGVGDGWFSVVLANRLPADGKRNLAVLVALEGHQDRLAETLPSPPAMLRLVVLAKWAFTSQGETFAQQVSRLTRQDMWLRVADTELADERLRTALGLGYVPLPHQLRHGDRTVSWYRGPGTPVVRPVRTDNLIFENADMALQYDPALRLLDASYAAAWQLGRLLALGAPEFIRSLALWEHGEVQANIMQEAEATLAELFPGQKFDRLRAAGLTQDDLLAALALEWSMNH